MRLTDLDCQILHLVDLNHNTAADRIADAFEPHKLDARTRIGELVQGGFITAMTISDFDSATDDHICNGLTYEGRSRLEDTRRSLAAKWVAANLDRLQALAPTLILLAKG